MKHSVLFFFCIVFGTAAFAQEKISLEQVVALAIDKNYDIQLSKNNSAVNITNNNYAWAPFLPQINGTASTVWNSNKQSLKFQDATKNASGVNKSNNVSASVQLAWTLFDGTKMFATRQRIAVLEE